MKKFLFAALVLGLGQALAQPFYFYNKIVLESLRFRTSTSQPQVRYYSFTDTSFKVGANDFYAQLRGFRTPIFLPYSNWMFYKCKEFQLDVVSTTPIGTGVRHFSIVGSNKWKSYKAEEGGLMAMTQIGNNNKAVVTINEQNPSGSIRGEFKREERFAPYWVALEVVSDATNNRSLSAASAEVLVTCRP
jgi:hypothetical protein